MAGALWEYFPGVDEHARQGLSRMRTTTRGRAHCLTRIEMNDANGFDFKEVQ